MTSFRILWLLYGLLIPSMAIANAPIAIPLTVREALPAGIPGMSRVSEPVTAGIPLPEDNGFFTTERFSVEGSVSGGQFRILSRWPNGNIQWLLADFQSSVTSKGKTQVILKSLAEPPPSQPNLAVDNDKIISVDTGAAQFQIRKARFNLFDKVTVGGKSLIASGGGRLVLRNLAKAEYRSTNDPGSRVVIEENGPLRTALKATGSFKDETGNHLGDYTLRLNFYKGKTYVKASLQLRNANKNFPSALYFHDMEAIVPLTGIQQPTVTLTQNKDLISETLEAGQRAILFQGYDNDRLLYPDSSCYGWTPPVPGACSPDFVYNYDLTASGLFIKVGDTIKNDLGNPEQWTRGFAELRDTNGTGLTVAMRWMSAYWPAGFDIGGDGTVSMEIFSKLNPKPALKLGFGSHEGRELIFDFHVAPSKNDKVLYALSYPLVASASFQHYANSGAIYGQTDFVTVGEQKSVFKSLGQENLFSGLNNPEMSSVYRFWPWSMGGGDNQTDFPLGDLLDFLRTGLPGFYVNGEHRTLFNAWTAVDYSDNFSLDILQPTDLAQSDPDHVRYPSGGQQFDAEHAHMMSMPLYYYLSGNEDVKDALLEYGQALDRMQIRGDFKLPGTPYFRAWNRIYRNFALIYEFSCQVGTCNSRYRNYVVNATKALLASRDDPALVGNSPPGRNLERGYVYWDPTLNQPRSRVVHSLFHTQIHFEAMWQGLRILDGKYGPAFSLHEDVEDYLEGLSRCIFDEYYNAFGSGITETGFQYDYALDIPYEQPSAVIPYDGSRAAWFAYSKTGLRRYLDMGKQLLWRTTTYATARTPSELQDQALMDAHFRRPDSWTSLAISAVPLADGYTLSWSIPVGARKVQIKYSNKPIVDWLGFDKMGRTYQYEPIQFTPYFAATNLTNEPEISSGGRDVRMNVRGLSCKSKCYFAARYYGSPAPKWLIGSDLMTWGQIPNSIHAGSPAAPDENPLSEFPESVQRLAYSNIALANTEIVIAATGGHGNSSDNRVTGIELSVNNPVWRLRNPPSPISDRVNNVAYYLDGKPSSRHSYWTAQYSTTLKRLMLHGTRFVWREAASFPDSNGFNLFTNTWDPDNTWSDGHYAGARDSLDQVWALEAYGSQLWKWSPVTDQWSRTFFTEVTGGPGYPMAHDDVRNQLFALSWGDGEGSETGVRPYVFRQDGTVRETITLNPSPGLMQFELDSPSYASMAYDDGNDCFWFWAGFSPDGQSPRLYKVIPNSGNHWDIEVASVSGTPPPQRSYSFGRMVYVRQSGVLVFMPSGNKPLYFVKVH